MEIIWGVLLSFAIAVPATYLGGKFPVAGAPVIAIFIGMMVMPLLKKYSVFDKGLKFTSKKILQTAVVLLGFSLSLGAIYQSGMESLPVIISTITISLVIAYVLQKVLNIDSNIATLVGVGSSICGGSAIAATAPVLDADDEEIATSISVIFLFNILAALIFPSLGKWLGMSEFGFGVFAGTAINDTSSVTAAASIWDSLYGANTLEIATVVKLTRTLAIIPIVLGVSLHRQRKLARELSGISEVQGGVVYEEKNQKRVQSDGLNLDEEKKSKQIQKENLNLDIEGKINSYAVNGKKVSVLKLIPKFLLLFLLASLIATLFTLPKEMVHTTKYFSKFFITMAMASIGLKTNLVKLIKTGGKSILLGFACWISIILTSLAVQFLAGIS